MPALGTLLADASITKVFHGGDYDIRLLKKDLGFPVRNVVDTMIAAQFTASPIDRPRQNEPRDLWSELRHPSRTFEGRPGSSSTVP